MYVWCFFLTLFQRNVLKLSKMNEVVISFLYFYCFLGEKELKLSFLDAINAHWEKSSDSWMQALWLFVCTSNLRSSLCIIQNPRLFLCTFIMSLSSCILTLIQSQDQLLKPQLCPDIAAGPSPPSILGYKGHQNQDRIMLSFVAS